jgi:D-beta-D-heptose 7-phosphate kinase/D-beta-D-heptose 1-phosphate adenosyltransferase
MKELAGDDGIVLLFVNVDAYIVRVKTRKPLISLEDRLEVLTSRRDVDVVISFRANSPCHMIDVVRPDIWVKGIEYRGVKIPEAAVIEAYGGELVFVDVGYAGHSSDILRGVGG